MGNTQSSLETYLANEEVVIQYQYTTDNGSEVEIPQQLDPYKHFNLPESASVMQIKKAFRSRASCPNRQERAMASLAYSMITSKAMQCFKKQGSNFVIVGEDIFLLAAIGHTKRVVQALSEDENLIKAQNEHGHVLLYIAARSGFYDLTSILISQGSPVNHCQVDGSTPLHAGAYFGQTEIVMKLLECGADPTIKNRWNHTPMDEAENNKITEAFTKYKDNQISQFIESLKKMDKRHRLRPVFYGNDIVAQEVIIDDTAELNHWHTAWHGTQYDHLQSILKYGLQPSGNTLPDGRRITTEKKHFKLGKRYFDVDDWARAIFVSPSLRYAAHEAYAGRIFSEGVRWCVVLKVTFDPKIKYEEHDPTTTKMHNSLEGEPLHPEYRIEASKDDVIMRIESTPEESNDSPVIVKSVVFIKTDFLDNVAETKLLSHEDICNIFS